MMLNFRTIMVTDGNAAVTDEDHNASLIAFYLTFGDIMSTDMLIACLERNAQQGSRRGGVTATARSSALRPSSRRQPCLWNCCQVSGSIRPSQPMRPSRRSSSPAPAR